MKQLKHTFSYLNRQRNSEISSTDRASGYTSSQVQIISQIKRRTKRLWNESSELIRGEAFAAADK